MAIRKDVVIKVLNNAASLDAPLYLYEHDKGIELCFKLMDYKYKYDKDPDNILNSSDEDILEAYTTIVNPAGYELTQLNGEVVDDVVKFIIEDSYTDELTELGTYQLQIHVRCEHSEFSIPVIQFEVLERLKGNPYYAETDQGVVDASITGDEVEVIEIVDGKLQLVWKKDEIITSTRLNAMVNYANSLHDEINKVANEVDTNIANKLQEQDTKLQQLETNINKTMNESITSINNSINTINGSIDTINTQQAAQDEKITNIETNYALKSELEAPAVQVEDSIISCDSIEGYAQNVEVLGNTIQDANNLADIRSVGDKVEGQELYEIPVVSTNENLFNRQDYVKGGFYDSEGFKTNASAYYSDKLIKVSPSTTYYYLSKDSSPVKISYNVFYDANKNVIQTEYDKTQITTTPTTKYIRVSPWDNIIETENPFSYIGEKQIYEPYQEDKLTILSPVQLEKVGNVADRLICKDGVWGVEKNIGVYYTNGEEVVGMYNPNTTNTIGFRFDFKTTNTRDIIVEGFYYLHNDDDTKHCLKTANQLILYIDRSELDTEDGEGFKKWLKDNKLKIVYQTTQPQFIPLPNDQQVKLRTFANKTNIHFETEIDGTIKASIPQSISSTISTHTEQIDNLNKELNRVKRLEESTMSIVATESSFTTVDATSNGYFEDIKLEGKTLVNLCAIDDFPIVNGQGDPQQTFNTVSSMRSGEYTLVFNCVAPDDLPRVVGILLNYSTWDVDPKEYRNGLNVIKLTIRNEGCNLIRFRNDTVDTTVTISNILLLEGDHTQNPPSYFEGLKSVGDGADEIEILSNNNGSLSNISTHDFSTDGTIVEHVLLEPIKNGESFKICYTNNSRKDATLGLHFYYPSNIIHGAFGGVGSHSCIYTNNSGETLTKIATYRDVDYNGLAIENFSITKVKSIEDTAFVDYKPYKSNKKQILYFNPTTGTWEKPILREWDSIEKHTDGKYYYHKRSGEVVLNGSEEWVSGNTGGSENIIRFDYPGIYNIKPSTVLICDRFRNQSGYGLDIEGITTGSTATTTCIIYVYKNALTSADVAGFKAWLAANPTTVVYQLATEEVYECINIDLLTYRDETNYIVNSGAIAPLSTLKVMCNINNVVRELQQKVSNLENYIQHVMIDALNNALNE